MVGVLILKELELGSDLTREIAGTCNLVELFGLAGCMGFWVWSEMANRRGNSDGRLLISPEKVVNGVCYLGGDLVRRRGNGREKNGVSRWGSFESCCGVVEELRWDSTVVDQKKNIEIF
ncbi:hypothetical protein KY289_001404 [Solanum tuberosum]|nr:hypothetical protein KY289_001404 [Solanum tuberosum]